MFHCELVLDTATFNLMESDDFERVVNSVNTMYTATVEKLCGELRHYGVGAYRCKLVESLARPGTDR